MMRVDLTGGTALITGASSGIGAAFARLLAELGCSLVLTARREERLRALASALAQEHGISIEILPADLSAEAGLLSLEKRIQDLDRLDLLVNNAGFGTFSPFLDMDPAEDEAMLRVHIGAIQRTCRAALPGMLARRRGAIINVASISAFMATPGSVTYAASKAYLVSFTEGLYTEVSDHGVAVQALCPGFTRTEIHEKLVAGSGSELFDPGRIPGWMWMQPEQVAGASLRALQRGAPLVVVPGLHYWLGVAAARSGLISPPLVARLKALFLGGKDH